MKRPVLWLCAFLFSAVSVSQTIPELFGTAKQQVKAEAWADALKTLETLEAESAKPGNEAIQKQLEGPLAFYRGVARANLGKTDEAVVDFGAFLTVQPNATIDKAVYSKKAVAAFEKLRRPRTPPLWPTPTRSSNPRPTRGRPTRLTRGGPTAPLAGS